MVDHAPKVMPPEPQVVDVQQAEWEQHIHNHCQANDLRRGIKTAVRAGGFSGAGYGLDLARYALSPTQQICSVKAVEPKRN